MMCRSLNPLFPFADAQHIHLPLATVIMSQYPDSAAGVLPVTYPESTPPTTQPPRLTPHPPWLQDRHRLQLPTHRLLLGPVLGLSSEGRCQEVAPPFPQAQQASWWDDSVSSTTVFFKCWLQILLILKMKSGKQ